MRMDIELPIFTKQRRHPRAMAPRTLMVTWQAGGRRGASHVRDLSLGGIYILNTNPPDTGTPMQLQFEAPEGDFRVTAQVRHVKPNGGMGAQFVGMDFPSRRRLSSMIQRLMA